MLIAEKDQWEMKVDSLYLCMYLKIPQKIFPQGSGSDSIVDLNRTDDNNNDNRLYTRFH